MIPVKLTIQGLYSYIEKQTIDFSTLTEAGLFGIFGSVGSGKSTILEAISFAVYSESERLNKQENRYYNMMNLKSDRMLIDFECYAGEKNNKLYRFVVESRRNSKNFEDVKSNGRSVYFYDATDWVPVDTDNPDNSVENITGLNYSNFRRTTIIPQGKFQEFLHLGTKERTGMLKEIFNLGKFDLFARASSTEKKYNNDLEHVNGRLAQLGELNAEDIPVMEEKINNLTDEYNALTQKLNELRNSDNQLTELKNKFIRRDELQGKLDNLLPEKDHFTGRKNNLEEYESCKLQFQSVSDSVKKLKSTVEKSKAEITNKESNLELIENEVTKLSAEFEKAEKDYNNREKFTTEATELKTIGKITENNSKALEYRDKIITLDGHIKAGKDKISDAKENFEKIKNEIAGLKKNKPDTSKLHNIKNWFVTYDAELKNVKDKEADVNEVNSSLEELNKQKNTLLNNNRDLFDLALSFGEAAETLTKLKNEINTEIIRLNENLNGLLLKEKLNEFSKELKPGEACPLCGSTEHPDILHVEETIPAIEDLRRKIEYKEKEKIRIDNLMQEINSFEEAGKRENIRLQQVTDKLSEAQKSLKTTDDKFEWNDYDKNSPGQIEEELKKSEKYEDESILKEKDKDETEKTLTDFEERLKNLEDEKREWSDKQNSLNVQSKTLKENITHLNYEDYKNFSANELSEKAEKLVSRIEEIVNNYNRIKPQLEEKRNYRNELSGELNSLKNALNSNEKEYKNLLDEYSKNAAGSKFGSVEKIENILARNIDIEKEKAEVKSYFESLTTLERDVKSVNTEIGENKYDSEKHDNIKKEIIQSDTRRTDVNKETGQVSTRLEKLKEDISQKELLTKEHEKLSNTIANLKTIKGLLKGNGFVNYVSTVYLRNLCGMANERFMKLTRNKLMLELNEDNGFEIVDITNGGMKRNVKTLSGGQTFQASLALALALSDSIRKTTEAGRNFFFLDEGFGTLDKDSLDIVFSTLKALRRENRIVGVISHVEELREEIEASINVVNDTERGSLITIR